MQRRTFIKNIGLSMLSLGIHPILFCTPKSSNQKTLILIELKGGNDGLNTVIPLNNKHYLNSRPNLAIKSEEALQIGQKLALHQSLKSIRSLWEEGDLAIIQGLGYPNPNRSHFRSIDIWDTGSNSDEYLTEGWIQRVYSEDTSVFEFQQIQGLSLGNENLGPLFGHQMKCLVINRLQQFFKQASRVRKINKNYRDNRSLEHLIHIQSELVDAAYEMKAKLRKSPKLKTQFPNTKLGHNMKTAIQLMAAGIRPAVIKISHGGFDTHSNQKAQHARLLKQLADAMYSTYSSLSELGLSGDAFQLTYSEFGRRVNENNSRGTDHGTANVHFALGQAVRGGFHGIYPHLDELERGDLIHTTDFRQLYKAIIKDWWQSRSTLYSGFESLKIIA
tara:strand:- start:6031 stop:7197 length:1167 start_codon:yes stop_codon:yes gene_type:complete